MEDAVGTWRADEVFEPAWSAERARDHLTRWRAVADAASEGPA